MGSPSIYEDHTSCSFLISVSAIGFASSLGLIAFYFVRLANSSNDDNALAAATRIVSVVVIVANIILWIAAIGEAGVNVGSSVGNISKAQHILWWRPLKRLP